jgi:hypothetical protein
MWANVKVTHKKYRHSRKARQKPDFVPAKADKRLASRFISFRRVTVSLVSTWRGPRTDPPLSAGGAHTGPRRGSTSSRTAPSGSTSRRSWGGVRREAVGQGSLKFRDLFVDEVHTARRFRTSFPPRMWGGEHRTRLRKTPRARRRSGSSGSGRRRKRRGGGEAEDVGAEVEERLQFFLLHGLCGEE